ncbi:MAG: flagellar hook protein FlgE [Phycisphaerae bacterium]
MGLTNAMYSGLSGMEANQFRIGTIGHNISNVNTTAYKGSRTLFQTQFSQIVSGGTPPSANSGGTNPTQIGLGTLVGATQRMHNNGTLEATGVGSDLAIQGAGFFVLRRGPGEQVYTRDGSFTTNSVNQLVTQDGHVVQGFGVDESGNIATGVLQDLAIPLGSETIARATANVSLDGDLSAAGTLATQGSISSSQSLVTGGGGVATGATALTDVRSSTAAGTPLFTTGAEITVRNVAKGDREVPSQTFIVGETGSTLDDFASWLEGALGIQPGVGPDAAAGVSIESGALVIHGNAGEVNNILLQSGDIRSNDATSPLPFQFTQLAEANGSGVDTSFTVYDSLGAPVTVNVSFALENTPNAGPIWRYFVESPDASGASRVVGSGTVSFDTEGNFLSADGNEFTIDRSDSGATTPVSFTLDLSQVHGLATRDSNVIMFEQDGYPPGILTNFGVGTDGVVSGIFDNGQVRTLGQVALARFSNPEALIAEEQNLFSVSPASGNPAIVEPTTFGAGAISAGTLESSNVDLSREFIGLITSSTGFQASSRVISTSSDLLNGLLLLLQ